MSISDKIREDLVLPKLFVPLALERAHKHCFPIRVPKKGGGYRSVVHPTTELKVLQYWLIDNLFDSLKIHDSATAYIKGASVLDNAKVHIDGEYFLKMDFKDFFGSISFEAFEPYLRGLLAEKGFEVSESNLRLISRVCFNSKGRLPIGYPTSPVISNAIMYHFDEKLSQFLDEFGSGKNRYTRYADDMFFSIHSKELNNVLSFVTHSVSEVDGQYLFLTINDKKTRFYSKGRGGAFVTGLRICYDGHITLHKKYKNLLRILLLKRSKGYETEESDIEIRGHLSHVRSVDALFYKSLMTKYMKVIKELKPF
jgi:RNA-directed DNA polymerase